MIYRRIHSKPRPWSDIYVGVAPGRDARWRGILRKKGKAAQVVDRARVLDIQRKAR